MPAKKAKSRSRRHRGNLDAAAQQEGPPQLRPLPKHLPSDCIFPSPVEIPEDAWSLETEGMRRTSFCLTLNSAVQFEVAKVTLEPERVYVGRDGEDDYKVQYPGGVLIVLREQHWATPLPPVQVLAGEVHLTNENVRDLEIHFRPDNSNRGDWPDHRACLQCPVCKTQANSDDTRSTSYVMVFQVLYTEWFSMRVVPRLYCNSCIHAVAGHLTMNFETSDGTVDLPVFPLLLRTLVRGNSANGEFNISEEHEPMDMYGMMEEWSLTGRYKAMVNDLSSKMGQGMGTRISKSRTKANVARMPVHVPLRRCTHPECKIRNMKMQRCAKCRADYCSREHQIEDWSRHKAECKVWSASRSKSSASGVD